MLFLWMIIDLIFALLTVRPLIGHPIFQMLMELLQICLIKLKISVCVKRISPLKKVTIPRNVD